MGEKSDRIKSLNQSETELLHFLFRDPNFKVKQVAKELYRGEGGVRTNLTAVFRKLGVPKSVKNKREYVVREYSEAYQYVFHQEEWEAEQAKKRVAKQPEMFIKPPEPVVVEQRTETPTPPATLTVKQPEAGVQRRGWTEVDTCGSIFLVVVLLVFAFFSGFAIGIDPVMRQDFLEFLAGIDSFMSSIFTPR